MSNLFPFTIHPYDNGHFIVQPNEFRPIVIREAKRRKDSWYAYGVTILSPTKIKVAVYGMKDMVYGGIGSKKWSFEADVDESVTHSAIVAEATRQADSELQLEEDVARAIEVARRTNIKINQVYAVVSAQLN